ncbi:MAG: DUF896 domain-containing protein [Clostridia bacterium]|nr:DUF896 domain-containing protein [Clostridia bacterium]MBR3295032.1 DUF896 domain-containing protein [Clostridia bacterium]
MEIKVLGRINELARIAKERELTPEEVEERARLRKEYLKEFRAMMTQTLDNTYIQYPDNTREKLTRKKPNISKD